LDKPPHRDPSLAPSPRSAWPYAIAAGVFALDRATKIIVERSVSLADEIKIIPGLFTIVHSENRGVAFGVFNDSESQWRTGLLIALSIAAVFGVSIALWRSRQMERLVCWAFALVLGGAAGNLFDRVISGRVTDFLLFYIGSYQWPSFNVADSAIVVGCGLLLLDQLRPKRKAAHVS
jgi:signal peptidase II